MIFERNEPYMRLWKKILVLVAAAVTILVIGGIAVYKFIVVPKYIEPVLITASSALRNADVQDAITEIAEDLADRGIINEATLKNYMRQARKYTSAEKSSTSVYSSRTNMFNEDKPLVDENSVGQRINTGNDNDTTLTAQTSRSSLGVNTVRSSEDSDGYARINETYSNKFNTDHSDDVNTDEEPEMLTLDQQASEELSPKAKEAISSSRANSLYNKIINAMSMHERTVFFSVIGKADTDKLMSLYKNSDRSGAKEYLQSILSSDEYAEAVDIFFRYAPLLLEE